MRKPMRALLVLGLFTAVASAADELSVERGKQVYQQWCWACHGPGQGKPGTAALGIEYKGSKPAALEERTDLTAPAIRAFVRKGVYFMPSFRKTEVSDRDLADLAAYLTRSNKGSK